MGGPTAMMAESAVIAVGPPITFTLLSPLAAMHTAAGSRPTGWHFL